MNYPGYIVLVIKEKAMQFLINSKKVVHKITSVENQNENYVFDNLISYDPGKRGPVTSSPQRQQGLAFRGDGNEDNGNFNQFVKLVSRYNPVLNRWLNKKSMRPYHVTYLGPRSQNEIIDILAGETKKCIVQEVQKVNIFSVMADTTTDISNQDRLAICIRYVNDNGERLLEISECIDKTGIGTAKQIIHILEKYGFSTDSIAFQSYDFASNIMSGALNDAQSQLSKIVGHKIPFVPCQAHKLNFFFEHSCEASSIVIASNKKTFSKLKLIKNYLRSTTCEERLNYLMVLNAEKDILDNLNILQISEQWTTLKQRRIKI
ncbi:hypothetical protein QTP88_010607 [Uroleucon formosanum]